MNVTYALQRHPKSIFLAGPTPRDRTIVSWRLAAIRFLEELGFDGDVIVPESADWKPHGDYDAQLEWEWEGLARATTIAFWIPRRLDFMPAFTTNVEFGLEAAYGKAVLGYPPGSEKMAYLDALAKRFKIPVLTTLEETMAAAIVHAGRWDRKLS